MKKDCCSKLYLGLAAAFGLPWLLLIVVPYVKLSALEPVSYPEDMKAPDGSTVYPGPRAGEVSLGAKVYAREGCNYCHSQMIRPTYAGADLWRPGWAGPETDRESPKRETRPADYLGETYAFLGYQRIGQDLSNVGYRIADRDSLHQHLYNPRSVSPDSIMPAYKHLYKEVYPDGDVSGDPKIVPTGEAEALVDYLLSLKKDAPLPDKAGAAAGEADEANPQS